MAFPFHLFWPSLRAGALVIVNPKSSENKKGNTVAQAQKLDSRRNQGISSTTIIFLSLLDKMRKLVGCKKSFLER